MFGLVRVTFCSNSEEGGVSIIICVNNSALGLIRHPVLFLLRATYNMEQIQPFLS